MTVLILSRTSEMLLIYFQAKLLIQQCLQQVTYSTCASLRDEWTGRAWEDARDQLWLFVRVSSFCALDRYRGIVIFAEESHVHGLFSCPTTTLALTYPSEKVANTDEKFGRWMTVVMLPTEKLVKLHFP